MIFTPILANFINIYDKIKNKSFIKSAQTKIQKAQTKIIAITGSNGKTSVKNILKEMLGNKYTVLASPKSYNTPLGLSKFINDICLTLVDFVILEYGARNKNDIKNLCKIFGADYGIITTISAQHLESFKTTKNVSAAKHELAKYLNKKLCVFNLDNQYTLKMFKKKPPKKIGVSIKKKAKIYATNICVKNFETRFDLHLKKITYHLSTPLLGHHNITNILLALSLAIELKVDILDLLETIKHLQPTPHRLQYLKGRINILDDSYNCSIESAKEALNVLKSTKNKKMILTPGIIEGGKHQYELNFNLGKMCCFADFIVIVGETNKKAILDGLKSQNYKTEILISKNLDTSKEYFSLLKDDDTLLILNDLPDDYA